MHHTFHGLILLSIQILSKANMKLLSQVALLNGDLLYFTVWKWVKLSFHRMEEVGTRVEHLIFRLCERVGV